MLTLDNILQSNSGGSAATSQTATLGTATTAGSTLYLAVNTYGQTVSSISGFTRIDPLLASNNRISIWRKANVSAGETSWGFTVSLATHPTTWIVLEVAGLDPDAPEDVEASAQLSTTSGTTAATNATATSTTYDGLVVTVHGVARTSTTAPTISGHTNDLVEVRQHNANGATISTAVSVAVKPVQSLGAWSSTVTTSNTLSSADNAVGWSFVVTAEGARRAADLRAIAGFEWGTANGIATVAQQSPFDGSAGSPTVTASTPRTGNWCLECSATSAAEYVSWVSAGGLSPNGPTTVARLGFRFVTSLPAGDVEVCSFAGTSAVTVRYRNASQKIGVQIGGGTEQLSDATVAADTWLVLEVCRDARATTWEVDWSLDYGNGTLVAQTQATLSGQTANGVPTDLKIGWGTAATATIRYDDIVVSQTFGHYPLGDHKVVGFGPDDAATVTVSGTSSNFGVMTANGTIGAWNAANALAAIDEAPPPTLGASADGIVQVNLAASDYVEIPMDTYDASGTGAIRAVRLYFAGWAASGTAATIGFRAHDGTTEHTLFGAFDPGFDNSTTAMMWVAAMVEPSGGWTQAKMDALTARVGFSGDATPDIGILGVVGEAAVQLAPAVPLFGTPTADLRVEQSLDPITQGIVGLVLTNLSGSSATLTYELNGVEQTPVTITDGTDGDLLALDAPDMPTISRVTLTPAPGV